MIQFQKEYLQIIQQQKQKAIISQGIFDIFSVFNQFSSTDKICGNSIEDAVNNIQNMKSTVLNAPVGKCLDTPVQYIQKKGENLDIVLKAPFNAIRDGKNVDDVIEKSANAGGKATNKYTMDGLKQKLNDLGAPPIKGITTEEKDISKDPRFKKIVLEYKKEMSKKLKQIIIQDAKKGITPNMWFDSSAKPENQKPIIFEDITYNFKTNNGKIICEEIQNKTKKRHLICESIIKEADINAELFKGLTWLSNLLKDNNAGNLNNIFKPLNEVEKADIISKYGLQNVDSTSPTQDIFKAIENIDPNEKRKAMQAIVKEKDFNLIDKTVQGNSTFDIAKTKMSSGDRSTLEEQGLAGHDILKGSENKRNIAKAAYQKNSFSVNQKDIEKPTDQGSHNPPPTDDSSKPVYTKDKYNHYYKDGERGQSNIQQKTGFSKKWDNAKGPWAKTKLVLTTIFNFIAKVVALIITTIIFCILLIWNLIKKIWSTNNINFTDLWDKASKFTLYTNSENEKEATPVIKFITGIALMHAFMTALSWGWNKLTGKNIQKKQQQAIVTTNNLNTALISDFEV